MQEQTAETIVAPPEVSSRSASMAIAALGGLLGGVVGGTVVVVFTVALKASMDFVAAQSTLFIIVTPLVGLALAVLVLQGIGTREPRT